MIIHKTTCDKCGKEINGIVFRVNVDTCGDYRFDMFQTPRYQSYDICPECMSAVITDDVKGSPYQMLPIMPKAW